MRMLILMFWLGLGQLMGQNLTDWKPKMGETYSPNVKFEPNKYRVAPSSFACLDSIAAFLVEHDSLEVEIFYYYQQADDYPRAIKMEKARAQNVANYLINKGIAATRLRAAGERGQARKSRLDLKIISTRRE